jgi:hypothetical protein
MNLEEFEAIFRSSEMKSWLNWESVVKQKCKVREVYSRSPEELRNIHTVWYRTPQGETGDWRNSEDTPLRLGEVTTTAGTWPAERKTRYNYFREAFSKLEDPLMLVLPSYSPNKRDVILLDGTHRAAAALAVNIEVRLMIFIVEGPCDPTILPDLKHYSS